MPDVCSACFSIQRHLTNNWTFMFLRILLPLSISLLVNAATAQPLPQRFLNLVGTQGVAGHEADVREAVRAQLPPWAKPTVDEIGNLTLTIGRGEPHLALVAMLDESGYVVSRIGDAGYLRLHRHTTGPAGSAQALRDQFMVGQPVMLRTASGKLIAGVAATPSTHLRGLGNAAELTRIKEMNDLWVDVGASNAATVASLGIRMLDPVNLRERATLLANERVAGVAAQLRAGAQTLLELLRGLPAEPTINGTVTIAWVTQSQFGARGLARLAQTIQPQRALLIGRTPSGNPPTVPGWANVALEQKAVASTFSDTPVETIDAQDIRALAQELAATIGVTLSPANDNPSATPLITTNTTNTTNPPAASSAATATTARPSGAFATLKTLIETYGVSGHEAPVREALLKLLPAWTKPVVDEVGNVSISFGSGGKALLFIAHMDEVGFEITGLRDDGSATVRVRGGVYLSIYEAHPVVVQTAGGNVNAVIAPRNGYATAARAQPDADGLLLNFGTRTAAETRALGIAPGQGLTVRKAFAELASPRATGRSMDDRAGMTAMVLALSRINPATVKNRVTFAFSVGEEVGLDGAIALAKRMRPDYAFAVDTFVSTDAPLDLQYLAHAPLGSGAVLRGLDNRTVVPASTMDRILKLAQANRLPLQIGVTQGGTDASAFAAKGAIDVGLSWPGRYSHSPVEVIDSRDLESLAALITTLAQQF